MAGMKDQHPDPQVTAKNRHGSAIRCAFCHDPMQVETQAPCAGCGVWNHPECRASNGGCTTLGCANQGAPVRVDPGRRAADARQVPGLSLRRGLVLLGAVLSGNTGVLGMLVSFLAMGTGGQADVVAGAAAFVAASLLTGGGLVAGALVSARAESPRGAFSPRAAAGVLCAMMLAVGALGMAVSFAVLTSSALLDIVAGSAGFVGGAVLTAASLMGLGALVGTQPWNAGAPGGGER